MALPMFATSVEAEKKIWNDGFEQTGWEITVVSLTERYSTQPAITASFMLQMCRSF